MSTLKEEIQEFCRQNNLRLNTNLGQHYLINQHILDCIIDVANLQPSDTVVEIGPGIGVLTRELLRQTANVITIEVDKRITPLLRLFLKINGFEQLPNMIEGDALQTQFPSTPYKIVANIPYHITSPLLRHAFLESAVAPTEVTLLIQREVAEKICSTKEGSVLSIMVQLFGTPTLIINVPPKDFLPPPAVDSSVIHIAAHKKPLADAQTIDQVLKLCKHGFSQKRKMLRNTFGSLPNGLQLLEHVNIDPTRRPQTLSVQEWITLAECSAQYTNNKND